MMWSYPIKEYYLVNNYFNNIGIKQTFLDRFYTDKHEWIDVQDKIGTVGISHYAQVIFTYVKN